MTKLQIKSDRITSFGGIYFVNRLFDQFSLGKVINDTLGLRSTAHNGYQWDEIVKSLFDIYLCGSDHIEDITSLMPCLSQAPDSHVPSSDTIGRGIKQLATDNITYGQEWKYIRIQHQRASERPADETQHGRGGFSRVVSSWMWTLTINSFPRRNTMPHTPTRKRSVISPVWQAWAVLSSM